MFERFSAGPRPDVLEAKHRERITQAAHKKALEQFEDDDTIDPANFKDYDKSIIVDDLRKVREREAQFAAQETPETERARKYATILEGIIHEQVELSDWLGPDVMTRKASRYDDIFNGVDSIAEFESDDNPAVLALSLDVTYAHPEKKLKRIRNEIDADTLSRIKYFESSDGRFQGSLSKVPRVIIGTDFLQIERLATLWVEGKKTELANDPVQWIILNEIASQLRAFQAYAQRNGRPRTAQIFAQNLRLIERVMDLPDKRALMRDPATQDALEKDRVHGALQSTLSRFQRL